MSRVQPSMSISELDEFRRSLRRFIERELMPFERRDMSEADREGIMRKAKDAGVYLIEYNDGFKAAVAMLLALAL